MSVQEPVAATLPRGRDAAATRRAILAAARRCFAAAGYEGAGLREIGRSAGVDPALVSRYFGGKEELFAAVLDETLSADLLIGGDRSTFGRRFAEQLCQGRPDDSERAESLLIILRAAASPSAVISLRGVLWERVMQPLVDWLGGEGADVRAHILSSVLLGLTINALIWRGAYEGQDPEPFVTEVAARLQRLVDG